VTTVTLERLHHRLHQLTELAAHLAEHLGRRAGHLAQLPCLAAHLAQHLDDLHDALSPGILGVGVHRVCGGELAGEHRLLALQRCDVGLHLGR
jgi:hypothetical protein